jgi:hypothetical protein
LQQLVEGEKQRQLAAAELARRRGVSFKSLANDLKSSERRTEVADGDDAA